MNGPWLDCSCSWNQRASECKSLSSACGETFLFLCHSFFLLTGHECLSSMNGPWLDCSCSWNQRASECKSLSSACGETFFFLCHSFFILTGHARLSSMKGPWLDCLCSWNQPVYKFESLIIETKASLFVLGTIVQGNWTNDCLNLKAFHALKYHVMYPAQKSFLHLFPSFFLPTGNIGGVLVKCDVGGGFASQNKNNNSPFAAPMGSYKAIFHAVGPNAEPFTLWAHERISIHSHLGWCLYELKRLILLLFWEEAIFWFVWTCSPNVPLQSNFPTVGPNVEPFTLLANERISIHYHSGGWLYELNRLIPLLYWEEATFWFVLTCNGNHGPVQSHFPYCGT